MKTNSTFKFPKEFKRILATILDPHKRGEVKRVFIDAQVNSFKAPAHKAEKEASE